MEMIATPYGLCQVSLHRSVLDDTIHTSYVFGAPLQERREPVLVRVQRAKPFAELLGLSGAANSLLPRLAKAGGVLVLLQDHSISEDFDSLAAGKTEHADQRAYGIGAQILRSLGVRQMRLMSACARVPSALAGHGLEITAHEAL
jgi:3,4-dihydroxy 2-butanone 4-phosphate synthase/GTP cyclohydrolase II